MKELSEMTATELTAEHDRLCGPADRVGGRPWKKGKARLIERLERLRIDAGPLGDAGPAARHDWPHALSCTHHDPKM